AADPERDIAVIDAELSSYAPELGQRRQVLAFNKMDVPEAQSRREQLAAAAERLSRPHAFISAAAREGTDALARLAFEELERIRELEPQPTPGSEIEVLRPRPRGPQFSVEREG